MSELIECPDCNGYGGERCLVDISDYSPCPTCDGTGKAEKGTKNWIQRLFETKE